jgi:hypothetical protein
MTIINKNRINSQIKANFQNILKILMIEIIITIKVITNTIKINIKTKTKDIIIKDNNSIKIEDTIIRLNKIIIKFKVKVIIAITKIKDSKIKNLNKIPKIIIKDKILIKNNTIEISLTINQMKFMFKNKH